MFQPFLRWLYEQLKHGVPIEEPPSKVAFTLDEAPFAMTGTAGRVHRMSERTRV